MTEIKIEKERPVWPLLVLGICIAAILIYYFGFYNKTTEINENEPGATADLISVNENNGTVQAYVTFIEADTNKMSLDHAFTNEALLKLTEATQAMADEVDFDIRADLTTVKEHADKITNEPFVDTHANHIRSAADVLTNALQKMQREKYPLLNNETLELRKASEYINPDVLTLQQKESVKTFFNVAADLLKKMN